MVKVKIIFLFLTLFLTCHGLLAEESFREANYPEILTSARALAMGNAFIVRANDESSSFYNPAGNSFHNNIRLGILSYQGEANDDQLSTMGAKSFFSSDLESLRNKFSAGTKNKRAFSRHQFHSYVQLWTLQMGAFRSKKERASLTGANNSPFEFITRTDQGAYGSFRLIFGKGIFNLGFTGMLLQRKEAKGDHTPSSKPLVINSSNLKQGKMINLIGGAKVVLPIKKFTPSFALTVHNMAASSFSKSEGYEAPVALKRQINAGFALTSKLKSKSSLHLEFNLQDIAKANSQPGNTRRFSTGFEADFADKFFFRLGLSDFWISSGIGIKTSFFKLDLTTYAIDEHTFRFRHKEDRRFILAFNTFFDL